MRAFLDRGLREADEDLFGQTAGGEIDLDLNGQGLDADERERLEFGEHNDFIPLSRWEKFGVRAARIDVSSAPAQRNQVIRRFNPHILECNWDACKSSA